MRYGLAVVALILLTFATMAPAAAAREPVHTPDARMMRFPDVSVALELLEKNPPNRPQRPVCPDRSGNTN